LASAAALWWQCLWNPQNLHFQCVGSVLMRPGGEGDPQLRLEVLGQARHLKQADDLLIQRHSFLDPRGMA
jgi:hypothetical protein